MRAHGNASKAPPVPMISSTAVVHGDDRSALTPQRGRKRHVPEVVSRGKGRKCFSNMSPVSATVPIQPST